MSPLLTRNVTGSDSVEQLLEDVENIMSTALRRIPLSPPTLKTSIQFPSAIFVRAN